MVKEEKCSSVDVILFSLGNASLIYTIIRKRQIFYSVSNFPTDEESFAKLTGKGNSDQTSSNKINSNEQTATMTTSLADTPCNEKTNFSSQSSI